MTNPICEQNAARLASVSGMNRLDAGRTLEAAARQFEFHKPAVGSESTIKGHEYCTKDEPDPRCSMHGDEDHRHFFAQKETTGS